MNTVSVSSPLAQSSHELQIFPQPYSCTPVSEDLVAKVLEPYSFKNCRYLRSAHYSYHSDLVHGSAQFTIPESVYIRSTGHFNAVELLLCFNQMFYCILAQSILHRDIDHQLKWNLDEFFQNQLSHILIKSTSTRFKKQITASPITGSLSIDDISVIQRTHRYVQFHCTTEFHDSNGGFAIGEFEVVITNT